MYGLVNKAIQDLVTKGYGEDAWKEVCKMSGFADEDFVGMEPYPDSLTYELVGNISKLTGMDNAKILELFGEHWILYTADEGYGDLMDLTGSNFVDFLNNLDMLHERINNIMPHLAAPEFKTRNKTENSIELEYRSHREGFIPMLNGLIKGLGKRFDMEVTVEQIDFKNKGADCDVFLIKW
jgi:hypothetical protein